MEGTQQLLAEALRGIADVYLGHEMLLKAARLPCVVVVPDRETLSLRNGTANPVAADTSLSVFIWCRATTFQDARQLALLVLQVPGLGMGPNVELEFDSDPNKNHPEGVVRDAVLKLRIPAQVLRAEVGRALIESIRIHARQELPATQEEPNDQANPGNVRLDFHEHGDPPHRGG